MIVYFSAKTEFTKRFVDKLDLPNHRIAINSKEILHVAEPFVLITPTYCGVEGLGEVPPQVYKFLELEQNRKNLKGVIGTGNRNFFTDFAKSASKINAKFNVPILYRLELAGTNKDVTTVRQGVPAFLTR